MKEAEVPTHMVDAGLATAGDLAVGSDGIRRIIAAAFTADEKQPPPPGCACRVCTGKITIDWDARNAVPDTLVEAFELAAFEAAHGHPVSTEEAYIRGGLVAVLAKLRKRTSR